MTADHIDWIKLCMHCRHWDQFAHRQTYGICLEQNKETEHNASCDRWESRHEQTPVENGEK